MVLNHQWSQFYHYSYNENLMVGVTSVLINGCWVRNVAVSEPY
jgi:hypothetical protein